MSKNSSILIALGVVALLLAAGAAYMWATGAIDSMYAFRSPLANNPPTPGPALGDALTRRVVFVLIDGLREDTSRDASVMPFLAQLRAQGASAAVHSHAPSFSAPSYTVLFTGAWPDVSDGPAVNLSYDQYWTWTQDNLFSAIHRDGMRTAVSGYNWFEKLIPQDAVTDRYYTPGEDAKADREVVDAALPWLKDGQDQFVLIHLDQVDYAGHHEGGPVSPNWAAAASRSDELLREIVATLDLSKDTVLVTSDHGHIDRGGHGGPEPVLLVEPLVLAGAGVTPGRFDGAVRQVDIAPTVAALLGANIPASSEGSVASSMLDLPPSQVERLNQAVAQQQAGLASAYARSTGGAASGELPVPALDLKSMQAQRLNQERLPRLVLGLVWVVALAVVLWRARGRTLLWALAGVAVYLVVFNVRYVLLSHRTYSLTTVGSANDLIVYALVNTLLAFVIGWLVFVVGARLFLRGPAAAARLTLGWALLAATIAGLPAIVSFVVNGPLIRWTLPEMWTFFLGFLATIQILFIAVFGILFAGLAAVVARVRRPAVGVA